MPIEHYTTEDLALFVCGDLDDAHLVKIGAHLESCSKCQNRLRETSILLAKIAGEDVGHALDSQPVPDSATWRMTWRPMTRVAAAVLIFFSGMFAQWVIASPASTEVVHVNEKPTKEVKEPSLKEMRRLIAEVERDDQASNGLARGLLALRAWSK